MPVLFSALLNWNFIMAGAASTNAVLLTLAVVLMLAWKVGGWYGLDRYLLPRIGAHWTWRREQSSSRPPSSRQPRPSA